MSEPGTDAEANRSFAEEVVRGLREAGFQALWAGGCVRDLLLDLEPADYDVATDATPEQVMKSLPYRSLPIGASFGVVRVRHPRRRGIEVEVATFRSDLAYIDGRRPTGVVFSSPELDAARRDFTINGMFMDPVDRRVIDYVGGLGDLDARLLRAIGDPSARFDEDKLRLLRAVRFASRFDLEIEPETLGALRAMAPQVVVVSPERIAQELRRMLVHRDRAPAMRMAMDYGLLAAVLPPTSGLPAEAWERTLRVLDALPERPDFPLAFAALLHGLDGRTADALARGLRLSNADRERTAWLVTHHRDLVDAPNLGDARLKRMLAKPGIDELLAVHRAVATASTGDVRHVDYCEDYLRTEPSGPIDPPPLLTGDDLVRHGLKPGARFATLLDQVRDAQLDGRIGTRDEALAWIDQQGV
jgi:poly(A) polymerase